MALRSKLYQACESFLRVPPLLVIDEIFRVSFGFGGRLLQYGVIALKSNEPNEHNLSDLYNSGGLNSSDLNLEATTVPSGTGQNNGSVSVFLTMLSYLPFWNRVWWSMAGEVAKGKLAAQSPNANALLGETSSSYMFQLTLDNFSNELAGDLIKISEIFLCLTIFILAFVMFMLSTENLLKLYSYLISFATYYTAYITSPLPSLSSWTFSAIPVICLNLMWRSLLFAVYSVTISKPEFQRHQLTALESVLNSLQFLLFFASSAVDPYIFTLLIIISHRHVWMCLPKVVSFLKAAWSETKRVQNEYGLSHLLQVESARLRINSVFRLFWVSRAAYDAFYESYEGSIELVLRRVMTHGTETFTGIVGLTVTVSALCHQIGDFLLWTLYYGTNSETDANRFGSISTVLFFILSLQSGLTTLDPEKRLDRLLKNLVLLGTALLHAFHQMVAPLLHAFRTFQALQMRAAMISVLFFTVTIASTIYLYSTTLISTWSLAVLALAIEFKIKILVSLIISIVVYLSQLVQYPDSMQRFVSFCRRLLPNFAIRFFDHLNDQVSHEDMVFYLKSIANMTEFLTGIFLFANAIWIFLFESASAIRAIGMSIHAYFNIWCEAQKGWKIYCQRKTASLKIESLADATDDQLRERQDDVCAICYEEMESAKVTNCGHLFHAVCLRKWLYVQNTCPLCHDVLYGENVLGDGYVHVEEEGDDANERREVADAAPRLERLRRRLAQHHAPAHPLRPVHLHLPRVGDINRNVAPAVPYINQPPERPGYFEGVDSADESDLEIIDLRYDEDASSSGNSSDADDNDELVVLL